ncbi:unnamed protein product [Gongylonema pulchrum]|uniref:G_PROTEIN_RECEP_F1_2 domain-containing protein n=1 Tax=Gongylonema pulchrum TaxID=637853 RepID=A0A183ERY1_9BILA|nr:unnamed protein product [Gongylonema pulchrum]
MKLCKSSEDCRIANSTVSFCAFPALLGNMSFMRITLKRNAPVMLYVALAMINAIPCIYLDGQNICSTLIDIVFRSCSTRRVLLKNESFS